jgi:hypothetical protein
MGNHTTGPDCRVCVHAQRHLIELALVHKLPMRVIAKRFDVSHWSILRHKQNHMSPQLIAALAMAVRPSEIDLEQLQRSESEGLLSALISQRARLALLSEMCFEQGELHAAVTVERATTASLELTSKLLGMIIQRHDVRSTSMLLSADYLQLRATVVAALKPYPDAARAVGAALAKLELAAATEIKAGKPLLLEATPA